ncbi:hypothetical protein [Nocardioides sp. CFH 31398]|uniref:hypothetical protein n=1 Tax=Nocardioides sp. CFH 31398 TaxID=2919579 RepID=UPI001F05F526|nr:hypothetical protein [Nocardioides sp. CFH 31398]MCH1867577.1 hypothetical protein [Nocardioides sp. CFH 31398]
MTRLGLLAGALVALAAGLALAFLAVTATVPENCPWYDDEGPTAAPGSLYSAALCGSGGSPAWALLVVGLASLVLAAVVLVGARRVRQAPWIALGLLAAGPLVLVLVLTSVLPQGCLGGDDGTERCETDREQL